MKMLNREICKKCHREIFGEWLKEDDDRWDYNEQIYCAVKKYEDPLYIYDNIPKKCKFYLEHIISDAK